MKIENKSLINEGKTIIEFWAPWCGPCKAVKPIVENFAETNSEVQVYFCNVDEEPDMASQYGIRNIPTLIYLDNGEIKNRHVGRISYDEIVNLIDS